MKLLINSNCKQIKANQCIFKHALHNKTKYINWILR